MKTSLMVPAVELDGLTKKFDSGFVAVDNITCTIAPGSMIGLLGPNGAGKTTLMHMLLGILAPTSGSIKYHGTPLTTQPGARSAVLSRIGFASSYVRLPGKLTVAENLMFYGALYGQTPAQARERMNTLLTSFDLHRVKEQACYTLSAGQATRVTLAKAFMGYPLVVLLDEPTAALDVDMSQAVLDFIKQQQHTEGTTILFTSHTIQDVSNLCEKVIVVQRGKMIAYSSPTELISQYANSRIRMMVTDPTAIQSWAAQEGYAATIKHGWVHITVPEVDISTALARIVQAQIPYEQLAIEPPTLTDYFTQLEGTKS